MWVSHNTFRLSMHLVRRVMKQEINICKMENLIFISGNFYEKCIFFGGSLPSDNKTRLDANVDNIIDELSWLWKMYRERERDNFNLWGLKRTDMITTEWDRWGMRRDFTFVKQNEACERQTHSYSDVWELRAGLRWKVNQLERGCCGDFGENQKKE